MDKINHLYWRAGFGLSPGEWQERKYWSTSKAVDSLFKGVQNAYSIVIPNGQTIRPKELNKEQIVEMRKKERKLVALQNVDWIKRMASSKQGALLERMALFWHDHFACTTKNSRLAIQQLNTIQQYALGNFRDLVLAIAKDASMIRFLNNQQNRKRSPNENFARELLELFTIGRGNYSEKDIKEAARAFTGWSSNLRGEYVFRQRQHDYGRKTFFGKTGDFNGDDIVDIILERRETATYITTKIYRYFVNEKVDNQIIQHLSQLFYRSDYNIGLLMRTIFESDWFYDAHNIGTKIKSPVELMAGIMRSVDVNFKNELGLIFVQRALGQVLFNPPNVAGWPGGKSWIDNSTLMLRLNLVNYLFYSAEVNLRTKDDLKAKIRGKAKRRLNAKVNINPILDMLKGQSNQEIFEHLAQYLLQAKPQIAYRKLAPSENLNSKEEFIQKSMLRLMSLPEYQMC